MAPIRLAASLSTCALIAIAAMAEAQEAAPSPTAAGRMGVEVASFLSVGGNDVSSTGAAFRFPIGSRFGVEVETEWPLQSVSGLNATGNVVVDLPRMGRVTPYAIGGAGINRYTVTVDVPGLGSQTNLTSDLAVNAGGGVRIPVSARWGMRTDARVINGLGRGRTRWRVFYGATVDVGGGSR
jgi:opacity protein-like surface antigen